MQGKQQKEKNLDPLPIGTVISDSPLAWLINKASRLIELDKLLKTVLPEEMVPHCRVMNYQNQVLTIETDSGAWATTLRYQERDLVRRLLPYRELSDLRQVIAKVRPSG